MCAAAMAQASERVDEMAGPSNCNQKVVATVVRSTHPDLSKTAVSSAWMRCVATQPQLPRAAGLSGPRAAGLSGRWCLRPSRGLAAPDGRSCMRASEAGGQALTEGGFDGGR